MFYDQPRVSLVSKLSRFMNRIFPKRYFLIRSRGRLYSYPIEPRAQVIIGVTILFLVGWVGYSIYAIPGYRSALVAKDVDLAGVRANYRILVSQMSVYNQKTIETIEKLEKNHKHVLSLVSQSASVSGAGDKLQKKDAAVTRVISANRERGALRAKLALLEKSLTRIASSTLAGGDTGQAVELQEAVVARDLAQTESKALRGQVADLEKRLAQVKDEQTVVFKQFADFADDHVKELHESLAETGINLDKLIEKSHSDAQGGPFIPIDTFNKLGAEVEETTSPGSEMSGAANLEGERTSLLAPRGRGEATKKILISLNGKLSDWNALQMLADSMPLGQPLHRKWRISSPFGERQDPFTHKPAMHLGIDMVAPFKSKVYATAPGRVSYAGWMSGYGRLVEVKYDNGFKSRFGHLDKLLVKKGDEVTRETALGLLGNSGRSTGPHLHYEVVYRGKHFDPYKFVKAGANVL